MYWQFLLHSVHLPSLARNVTSTQLFTFSPIHHHLDFPEFLLYVRKITLGRLDIYFFQNMSFLLYISVKRIKFHFWKTFKIISQGNNDCFTCRYVYLVRDFLTREFYDPVFFDPGFSDPKCFEGGGDRQV